MVSRRDGLAIDLGFKIYVDKYHRYLADGYLRQRTGGKIFLNNALLENGHAIRMDPSAQENWIP